ncbi:MAG TPA: hypothetical protein VL337_15830 [Acidimicrobiales bacterium]|nr:hypothetical protein [Acidimicrobiales bacterium]
MATVIVGAIIAACVLYPLLTRRCLSHMHKHRHWRWSGRHHL